MEDAKIAKLLISSIIGEKIVSLDFRPQEYTADIDKSKIDGHMGTLTVYHLDFAATIKTGYGLKQVLIEIQKAKFATDIMRFRAYLGGQYSNRNNTEIATIEKHSRKIGIPIIGIYFLGHELDYAKSSIIGVNRTYKDLVTNEQLTVKESFIESLTHDSYVIVIPNLAKNRRNELEKLLSIFDQSTFVDADHHILNVKEEDYPAKHRSLIRRLQSAIVEPEMRKQMDVEDNILCEFEGMQREIMQYKEKIAEFEQDASVSRQEASEAKQEASEAKLENEELRKRLAEFEKSR
ncbi:MAG: hypothetical protein WCP20_10025 [Desulfuromonadales bacterium]